MDISKLFGRFPAVLFIVAAAAFLTHTNTLWGDFVYDDLFFIVENDWIKDIFNAPIFFTSKYTLSDTGHHIYRPLRTLSFSIDYAIWGLNPLGFHLTNVSLHAINSALVLALLKLIFGGFWMPFLASLLFAVHPAQVQAVAWISSRGDLLYVFFFLISLILYILSARRTHFGLRLCPLIFFALALLSKEAAISMPLLLLCYDLCFRNLKSIKEGAAKYAPYVGLAATYVIARYSVLGEIAQGPQWTDSFYRTILALPKILLYYFRMILLPGSFRIIYDVWIPERLNEPMVLASLAIATIGIWYVAILWRRNRALLFPLSWFFVVLLPVSNIVPIRTLIQEHFLYLAIPGAAMFFLLSAKEILSRISKAPYLKRGLSLISAVVVLLFAAQSVDRSFAWRDGYALWSDAAAKSPNIFRPHYDFGLELQKRAKLDKALSQYALALQINPYHDRTNYNWADYHYKRKNFDRALIKYKIALLANSAYILAYIGIGAVYTNAGFLDMAIAEYKKGLALNPDDKFINFNLGTIYQNKGYLDGALRYFQKAAANWGDGEVQRKIGLIFSLKEQYTKAISEYKTSINIDQGQAMTYSNLGAAYQNLGLYEKAIDTLRHSLALNPDSYAARSNLAKAYSLTGSMDKTLYTYLFILASNDLTESFYAPIIREIASIKNILKSPNE